MAFFQGSQNEHNKCYAMIKTEQKVKFSSRFSTYVGNITPCGPLSTVITQKLTNADGKNFTMILVNLIQMASYPTDSCAVSPSAFLLTSFLECYHKCKTKSVHTDFVKSRPGRPNRFGFHKFLSEVCTVGNCHCKLLNCPQMEVSILSIIMNMSYVSNDITYLVM